MVKNLHNNKDDINQKNDLFDKDFRALSHDQAIKLLGKNLQPAIKSPWEVVILQCYLTIVFTILVWLINIKLQIDGVVISVSLTLRL